MAKRIITPSKGGRDCRPPSARITAATLAKIGAILAWRGKTYADWLTAQVDREHKIMERVTQAQTSEATE